MTSDIVSKVFVVTNQCKEAPRVGIIAAGAWRSDFVCSSRDSIVAAMDATEPEAAEANDYLALYI